MRGHPSGRPGLLLLAVLVAAAGVAAVAWCAAGEHGEPPEAELWGRGDAKEVDVNSRVAGRVVDLLVREGELVSRDAVLARIDNRDLRARLDQAREAERALSAQLAQADTATVYQAQAARAVLAIATAQRRKAEADLNLATKDYRRYQELLAENVVSRQVFEANETRFLVSRALLAQAQGAEESARAGLLRVAMNRDNRDAVARKLEQARAAVREAQVFVDESKIRAPFDGIVTTKYVEEGAMVSTGMPLVAIQDPGDNWVDLKIRETELDRYPLGATVHLEGRDGRTRVLGRIADVSHKAEFATYRATDERGETDTVTFNVKIRTDAASVRPGMRFRVLGVEKDR